MSDTLALQLKEVMETSFCEIFDFELLTQKEKEIFSVSDFEKIKLWIKGKIKFPSDIENVCKKWLQYYLPEFPEKNLASLSDEGITSDLIVWSVSVKYTTN